MTIALSYSKLRMFEYSFSFSVSHLSSQSELKGDRVSSSISLANV
jgi:hypothetical protein